MPLITCYECGRENVSDNEAKCPGCGENPLPPSLVKAGYDYALYANENAGLVKCIGFYADGTVIAQTISGRFSLELFARITKWFNKGHEAVSKGQYSHNVKTDNVCFSTVSESGTVDYSGIINPDGTIMLDIYSHIVKKKTPGVIYRFAGYVKNGQLEAGK